VEAKVGATLEQRVAVVRRNLGLVVQAALAAGIAWFIAHSLLHHGQPYFAPISAVATLAVSVGQRIRRAVEIVIGNAFGILLGEVLVMVIGRGAWQVSLVVLIAIIVTIFTGGSPALVVQSASAGALVVAIIPVGNYLFGRFTDAIVGGSVGLAVISLLLPLNPLRVVSRTAGPLLDAITSGLAGTASGLAERDTAKAQAALGNLQEADRQFAALNDAVAAGREITLLAPLRWGKRGALSQYVEAYDYFGRATRDVRILVRRSLSAICDEEPVPPTLASAVRSLSEATRRLRREFAAEKPTEGSRAAAIEAVHLASEAYLAGLGFSGSVVVAQIRSTATDLMGAGGMEPRDIDLSLSKAVGKASVVSPPPRPGRPGSQM
jgi:uncharacterized membrane protein YgaE (UPF0421/DUF939 family)